MAQGSNRLRAREVAALERALESERASARAARDHCTQLQQALDGERSAVRAMRREAATQAKTIREEEAKKYAALVEQLRTRLELAQSEAVALARETTGRALAAQLDRELAVREEHWRRDTRRQLEELQDQLRQVQRAASPQSLQPATDALVHSLHVDFQRTLSQKQEQWRTEIKTQVEDLTCKLRELQQLYTYTCNKLTTTTNEAENIPKLRQEVHALKLQNKELEERNQMLLEAEKRKMEEFRMQHDEHASRIAELQRTARKETLQLLEELKSKERLLSRQELQQQHQRANPHPVPQPRTKRRIQEGRKPPDPPRPNTYMEENNDDEYSAEAVNNWTKKVGLDTLYQLLIEEHQELQRTHLSTMAKLKEEEHNRIMLEEQLRGSRYETKMNTINVALAEQIQTLQERTAQLEAEAQDLREQNDLLEFRILELDDTSYHIKSPSSRSPDNRDMDDVSDSGVLSLTTSEDISVSDFQDFKLEPNNKDIKSKLSQICKHLENAPEKISIQQTLALLKHYEMRLDNLDSTLAVICQESNQNKPYEQLPSTTVEQSKSPSRVVATVLPFTELPTNFHVKEDTKSKQTLKDKDCMQESGIFEESTLANCFNNMGTQTDWTFDPPPGDLGAEIRKLTQIRERIEEEGGNKKLLKCPEVDSGLIRNVPLKDLIFYKERVQMLEDKVAIYESSGEEQSKLLAMRLEKEVLLAAQVKHLQDSIMYLKKENQYLEEEKCELEEAENDTRLKCQKLEVKLSALGEKKSDLQVQLQQNARTMSNLRSTLYEEERKRNEARQHAAKMEAIVHRLEQQNFEMEEKEMEVRYRLHALENIVPAMVMYYLWRMLNAVRPFITNNCYPLPIHTSSSDSVLVLKPTQCKEDKHKRSSSIFKLPSVTKENLRNTLQEMEHFLLLSQEGVVFGTSGISPSSTMSVIEKLSSKCDFLQERMRSLEIKEKVYQETLQNGDDILNKMETDYIRQIKSIEEELLHKQSELERAESKLKNYSIKNELVTQMQERVNHLEIELLNLKDALVQKDKEKKILDSEKINLINDLDEANDTIEKLHKSIGKMREEEEYYKKKMNDLLGDLDLKEQDKNDSDEFHHKMVNELKRMNTQAYRELEEAEVTISELKEEVQTLEREVGDLRLALCDAKESKERILIQVGAELEAKDQQIRSLGCDSLAGSLHEELLELDVATTEHQVDDKSTTDVPASITSHISRQPEMLGCLKAEQIIKDFDPLNSFNLLEEIKRAYQHSRICLHCKTETAVQLRLILNILHKIAPQSIMAQINHILLLR